MNLLKSHIHSETVLGSTPLHFAALRKDTRFLSFLLRHDVDINTPNYYNETPLHWAVKGGHKETVEFLLSCGAKVDLLDSEHKSAKDWAVEEDHVHLLPLFPKRRKPHFFVPLLHHRIPELTLS